MELFERKPEIFISIDSSTTKTGYTIWKNQTIYRYGLIDESEIKEFDYRFKNMMNKIYDIIWSENPDFIVIERMHKIRNIDGYRKLCEIVGAIRYICCDRKIGFEEMSPAEWRKYTKDPSDPVPKKTEDLKKWSVSLVEKRYGICVQDDIADSILIGNGYINKLNSLKKENIYEGN